MIKKRKDKYGVLKFYIKKIVNVNEKYAKLVTAAMKKRRGRTRRNSRLTPICSLCAFKLLAQAATVDLCSEQSVFLTLSPDFFDTWRSISKSVLFPTMISCSLPRPY